MDLISSLLTTLIVSRLFLCNLIERTFENIGRESLQIKTAQTNIQAFQRMRTDTLSE